MYDNFNWIDNNNIFTKHMKHTPGPWRWQGSQSKHAFNVIGTVLGGKYKIARCPYVLESGEQYLSHNSREVLEAEANAKLIAAAPEMYDLLKRCEGEIHVDRLWNELKELIKRIES